MRFDHYLLRAAFTAGLSLFMASCDPSQADPQWPGIYVGSVSNSGTCSDGSSWGQTSEQLEIVLTRTGDTVTWEAPCSLVLSPATVIADIDPDGDTAMVRPYACPHEAPTKSVPTRDIKGTGGTLTLRPDSLYVELKRTIAGCTVQSGCSNPCNVQFEGDLMRLGE